MTASHPKPRTLFFAGTDTDVGKTHVACMVARVLRQQGRCVGVYKPVASGCRDEAGVRIADDAVALANAANCIDRIGQVCPQKFLAPLAPPAAASLEGRQVDPDLLRRGADFWDARCDTLIVEGAGGLLSPLADGVLNIDLAIQFPNAKLFVVAANRLGAIHQTLATTEAAMRRGVIPAGIVLCDVEGTPDRTTRDNAIQISRYTNIPIIAEIAHSDAAERDSVYFEESTASVSGASDCFFSMKFIDALFMQ